MRGIPTSKSVLSDTHLFSREKFVLKLYLALSCSFFFSFSFSPFHLVWFGSLFVPLRKLAVKPEGAVKSNGVLTTLSFQIIRRWLVRLRWWLDLGPLREPFWPRQNRAGTTGAPFYDQHSWALYCFPFVLPSHLWPVHLLLLHHLLLTCLSLPDSL